MINSVALTGRLTKDPEMRTTQTGKSACTFTLAVDRKKKDQPADFIRCKSFGTTADIICQYLHKGSLIGVEGSIQTDSYQNQQRQMIYTTDVLVNSMCFLESSKQAQQTGYQQQSYSQPNYGQQQNYCQGGYQSQNYQQPQASQQSNVPDGYQDLNINPDDLPF